MQKPARSKGVLDSKPKTPLLRADFCKIFVTKPKRLVFSLQKALTAKKTITIKFGDYCDDEHN